MGVEVLRNDVASWLDAWEMCRDAYLGSRAVKLKGGRYLPPLGAHAGDPAGYDAYKMRALFYNATGRTVDGLSGGVFQQPPKLKASGEVEEHMQDVTLTGVPLDLYGLLALREVLKVGRVGLLLDMTRYEDLTATNRPYWLQYRAEDVINWRTSKESGDEKLTMVVMRETYEEPDPKDPFVLKPSTRYRVLRLNEMGEYSSELWVKAQTKNEYQLSADPVVPLRKGKALTFIPFVFVNPVSIGVEIEKPPVLDLVEVNMSHYRTSADLEHGRHFTALPTPWVAGRVADTGEALHLGSTAAWVLDKDGKAGMLEFTGAGLAALEKADEVKRKMMATLGARLLEEQAVAQETATAVTSRHAGEHASLRTVAGSIEQGLTMMLRWHAYWLGATEEPDDSKYVVELNKDFLAPKLQPQELAALVATLQAEAISYQTFYAQLTQGRIARPGVDYKQELLDIEAGAEMFAPPPPQPMVPPEGETPEAEDEEESEEEDDAEDGEPEEAEEDEQ